MFKRLLNSFGSIMPRFGTIPAIGIIGPSLDGKVEYLNRLRFYLKKKRYQGQHQMLAYQHLEVQSQLLKGPNF